DGGGVGRAVVGQPRLPVGGNLAGDAADLVDVEGEGEGHHVRLQAVDHRPRLLAGAAVGLLDVDIPSGFFLPVFGEGGVVLPVELPGGVVGDVEDLLALRRGGVAQGQKGYQGRQGGEFFDEFHGISPD